MESKKELCRWYGKEFRARVGAMKLQNQNRVLGAFVIGFVLGFAVLTAFIYVVIM